jgi:hypothetical protein
LPLFYIYFGHFQLGQISWGLHVQRPCDVGQHRVPVACGRNAIAAAGVSGLFKCWRQGKNQRVYLTVHAS